MYWTIYVESNPDDDIKVTSITLNKTELTLQPGDYETLLETVLPTNATNKTVSWTTSNSSVATVSWGKVTAVAQGTATITCKANDGSGVSAKCSVTVTSPDIDINATNFPDEKFRNYLLSQDYGEDGVLTGDEIRSVTFINVDEKGISSLKGIEYFTALKKLWCNGNQLTTLDVSKNMALTELTCSDNKLTTLDMSKNTALATLYCYDNQLTTLDVSKNTALYRLNCTNNQLTILDVSKNTALTTLRCDDNQLTTLDVSNLTELHDLDCYGNQLTTLNVSGCTALKSLFCWSNQLKGEAMDALINSLPANGLTHDFRLIWDNTEGNVCTKAQVAAAKDKGWIPLCWGSGWKEYEGAINVTSITLNKTTLSLQAGQTETLTATVKPDNATDKTVTWSSSNTNVATVSSTGKVTANAKGSATITCNANDGSGKQAACSVTVTEPVIKVTSITLNKTTLSLQLWQIERLTATVKPDNATDKTVTWSEDNPDVAFIDSDGYVAAFGIGTATITCTANDGSGVSATCVVTVTPILPESISLPSTMTVAAGQTVTLTPTITPADAVTTLTWSSDDETIATVNSSGVVTGVKKGQTFINVETNNGKAAYCKLTVTAGEPTEIILPKNVTVTIGTPLTITATVIPEGAETTLTWKSDDETIVRVNGSGALTGLLTGLAEGLAIVTVSTSNGLTSNACKVKVEPDPSGINDVQMVESNNAPVFTLSGQRLAAPKKGINIVGGKKMVVK